MFRMNSFHSLHDAAFLTECSGFVVPKRERERESIAESGVFTDAYITQCFSNATDHF